MFKRRKSIVYLSASLVAIQSAGAAHAQAGVAAPPHTAQAADPGEQSPPPENGDIVVTALRRSERLQSVPASISAIGGDALASAHIASSAELSTSVPNLQATSTLGENVPIFSLRGVSMSDFSVNQQSHLSLIRSARLWQVLHSVCTVGKAYRSLSVCSQ